MTILYVIRHGETDWNRDGRYQGQADIPLNDDGRRQSQAIGARMARVPLDAIYASDLCRAFATAEAVAAGRPIMTDVRLREVNVGQVYGMTNPEIAAAFPDFWAAYQAKPETVAFPGGENALEVHQRAMAAVADICARHPGGKVALVSHGGIVKVIVTEVLGMPLHARGRIVLENCSLSVVEWTPERRRLRSLNDTGHLEQAPRDVAADF